MPKLIIYFIQFPRHWLPRLPAILVGALDCPPHATSRAALPCRRSCLSSVATSAVSLWNDVVMCKTWLLRPGCFPSVMPRVASAWARFQKHCSIGAAAENAPVDSQCSRTWCFEIKSAYHVVYTCVQGVGSLCLTDSWAPDACVSSCGCKCCPMPASACCITPRRATVFFFSIALKMNARDAITIFDSVCAESLTGALEKLQYRLCFPFASARRVSASTLC